jgi:hypothetical protein
MNKALITAIVLVAGIPAGAAAQERAGDAALGAVSGAVVLGPVGAVAGAFIGYAAGPSIAQSWGLRGSRSAHRRHPPRRAANRGVAPASQGTREAMNSNGQMRAAGAAPVQATPSAPAPAPTSPPPVQGFD